MAIRSFVIAALFFALCAGAALADEKPVGRFEVTVDLPTGEAPFVGEPLRLVLRTAVHARVAKDTIEQPGLTDFDWQQYGPVQSGEELVEGFWLPAHTRTLMIYPLRAGRLTIAPFKWRVTYLDGEGERVETEYVSAPLTIEARARDGLDLGDFWLPAKALAITDRWEPEPDRILPGETARRTVTVLAEGLTADRLPPLPKFRAPGVIAFAGPVERRTIVTDQGPVARAVYQWVVRPVSETTAATAPAIRLRWFDVAARKMREATAPERRVAVIGATDAPGAAAANDAPGLFSPRPLLAALLGFVSAGSVAFLAAAGPNASGESWRDAARRWRLLRALRALRAAGRRNDPAAFRRALAQLSVMEPERWPRVAARDEIGPALAALDASLFAREPTAPAPLRGLARKIDAALRDERRRG